jgi:hypothetical protein
MEDTMIEDIQTYLITKGVATEGTSFLGHTPDSPEEQVNVFDTGGPGPDEELFDEADGVITKAIQTRTFQIYVRTDTSDDAYADGRTKLNDVMNVLHGVRHQQIGDTYFDFIMANSAGGHIGRDEAGRDEFTANFTARIKT